MRFSILFAPASLIGGAAPSAGQATAELVSPTDQIPRGTYKKWSLFLVSNPDWVPRETRADLANLYRGFARIDPETRRSRQLPSTESDHMDVGDSDLCA